MAEACNARHGRFARCKAAYLGRAFVGAAREGASDADVGQAFCHLPQGKLTVAGCVKRLKHTLQRRLLAGHKPPEPLKAAPFGQDVSEPNGVRLIWLRQCDLFLPFH